MGKALRKSHSLTSTGLDDLCARFIINLPAEDLSSVARICFQVEEAQWFYEDFIRPTDATLPAMSLKVFCLRIFQHCPLLSRFSAESQMAAFDEFLKYKERIPVRGAIMLNQEMDSAVLVKGWKSGSSWSFPRGKINKDEDDLDCAIRELWEETGYDVRGAGHLILDDDHLGQPLDVIMREQHLRYYVFRGVPMDTVFEPKTRKEISKIQWYPLSDLPGYNVKKGKQFHTLTAKVNVSRFYMVAKFLPMLQKWIVQEKAREARRISGILPATSTNQNDLITAEEYIGDTDYAAYASEFAGQVNGSAKYHENQSNLQGTENALKALLKIQPLLEQSYGERNVGLPQSSSNALLALLKPSVEQHRPLRTPSEAIIEQPLLPDTPKLPQHQQSSPFRAPPPSFPVPSHSLQYKPEQLQHYHSWNNEFSREQHSKRYLPMQQQKMSYSSEPLQHPQPLPPQVQRAVFSSQTVQDSSGSRQVDLQDRPLSRSTYTHQSYATPTPHHQPADMTLRPTHPETQAQPTLSTSSSKLPLTQHTLSLLNAFKAQAVQVPESVDRLEQRHGEIVTSSLPYNSRTLQHMQQPTALSSAPQHATSLNANKFAGGQDHVDKLLGLFKSPPAAKAQSYNIMPTTHLVAETADLGSSSSNLLARPAMPPATKPINEALLNLFNSSKVSDNVTRDAITTNLQPAASDYSNVFDLSRGDPMSSTTQDGSRASIYDDVQGQSSSQATGFRPSAILQRSSQIHSSPYAIELSATPLQSVPMQSSSIGATSDLSFRPAILKNPSPLSYVARALPSSTTVSEVPARSRSPIRNVPFSAQNMAQKQALLSLFGSPASPGSPAFRGQNSPALTKLTHVAAPSSAPRSRVGSLAGQTTSHEQRMSSSVNNKTADQNFLLGFLGQQVAKGK